MKRQIRSCVFETNSSSVHSLCMCMESDYNRWYKGDLFLFTGSGWCYPDENKPKKNNFYTKDKAIEFEKSSKYPPDKDFNWDDEEDVMEMLHGNEWYDYHYYWNSRCEYYETFKEITTTPSGERVVSFGYYGYDG